MATSAGVNASSGRRGYLRYLYGNHFWIPEVVADFTRGIVRDTTRDAIPANGVYDCVDFLLDRPGVAYKRGGSAFQHSAIAGMASLIGVAAPEYPTSPRVVAFASDGASGTFAYDVTTGTPGSSLNCNGALLLENPPLHKDKLIVCDGKAAIGLTPHAVQKLYLSAGTLAVADLGGSPPVARYSCVHLSHLVLANSVANPNRVWFSPIPNIEGNTVAITSTTSTTFVIPGDLTTSLPVGSSFTVTGSTSNNGTYTVLASSWSAGTTIVTVASVPSTTGTMGNLNTGWDTANAWFDVPHEITGLASLQGVLIVFCRGESWRILGDIPPGQTGANMQRQPLAAVGCIDARSIVKINGVVHWAHESGMYFTNGAAPQSITHLANATGIGNLWADALYGYSPQLGSVVCAGVYLNKHLFVTVRHAASDPQAGARYQFLYYEPTGSWVRLADGVTADMYATAFAPSGEIYASCGDTSDPVRALKLSGLFKPAASNKTDANGDVVSPTVTFRTLTDGISLKAWARARLTYDMRDAASDNPTLAVDAARGMEATSFATMSTFVETSDTVRQRFSVACDSQAMTIRLTQSNASALTEIHALEVESRPYPRAAEGVWLPIDSIYDLSDKALVEIKSWLEPWFLTRDRGAAHGVAAAAVSGLATHELMMVFDGGGSVLTTGVKGEASLDFDCTITHWRLVADQVGSAVLNIWKDTYANYPPTVADKITASAPPTITADDQAESSTLTGWTTSVAAGDTFRFNLDSISTIKRLTLILSVTGGTGLTGATGPPGAPGGAAQVVDIATFARTAGNYTLSSTGSYVSVDTGSDLTVLAQAGDIVEVSISALWGTEAFAGLLDVSTVVGGTVTNSITGGAADGVQGWAKETSGSGYTAISGSIMYTVVSGDVSSGHVTFRLRYKTGGTLTLFASANNRFWWAAKTFRKSP